MRHFSADSEAFTARNSTFSIFSEAVILPVPQQNATASLSCSLDACVNCVSTLGYSGALSNDFKSHMYRYIVSQRSVGERFAQKSNHRAVGQDQICGESAMYMSLLYDELVLMQHNSSLQPPIQIGLVRVAIVGVRIILRNTEFFISRREAFGAEERQQSISSPFGAFRGGPARCQVPSSRAARSAHFQHETSDVSKEYL